VLPLKATTTTLWLMIAEIKRGHRDGEGAATPGHQMRLPSGGERRTTLLRADQRSFGPIPLILDPFINKTLRQLDGVTKERFKQATIFDSILL